MLPLTEDGGPCPASQAALLAGTVSTFLRLAKYYTGDNPIARAARDALGSRDAFYTNLQIELEALSKHVGRQSEEISIEDNFVDALASALNTLESSLRAEKLTIDAFPCLSTQSRHRRLHALCHHIRKSQAAGVPLKIPRLREMINMRFEPRDGKMLNKFLSQINKALDKQNRHKTKQALPQSSVFIKQDKKSSRTVSTKIRDQSDRLYRLLTQYWKCENHRPHTAAKLRLYTYRKPEVELRFDILFCAPDVPTTGKSQWQQTRVYSLVDDMGQDSQKSLAVPVGSRSVRFTEPKPKSTGRFLEEARKVEEGLCTLIKNYAERESFRLRILADKDGLKRYDPDRATQDLNKQGVVTLEDLILHKRPYSIDDARRVPKYKLQVTLANAFLHLNEGPWLLSTWNKAHISFFCPEDGGFPDLSSPYLDTQCCRPHLQLQKSEFQCHPYPSILALGILLLEIERNQPIEFGREGNYLNSLHHYIDADIPAAEQMLDDCEGESPTGFINAVKECIDADSFVADFGRNETFDNPNFRDAIFERIVSRLESALKSVWDGSPEELDDFTATTKTSKPKTSLARKRHHPPSYRFSPSIDPALPKSLNEQNSPRHQEEKYSQEDMSDADNWFNDLFKYVHPLFTIEKPITDPTTLKIFGRAGPVRIAIIDTGIDLPEVELSLYEDRLKDSLSFFDDAGGPAMKPECKDLDGHGTHAAGLIFRIAPQAHLYIARVFKTRDENKTGIQESVIHDRIARAIDHATDPAHNWNVDIISMSFGFPSSVPVIEKAIRRAAERNVVMLAAPSNEGSRSPPAWPARDKDVIDIYATDSYGNKCNFTPVPPQGSEKFAILGRAVMSSWPEDLDSSGEKRKSGTSIATPIAAGLVAIVLAYMKQLIAANNGSFSPKDIVQLTKIRSSIGMSVFLRKMVPDQGEKYSFLVPWEYIGIKEDTAYEDPHLIIPRLFLRDIKRR